MNPPTLVLASGSASRRAMLDAAGVAYARRMFADNDWPVIDVTRRSIEETAAAIIGIVNERNLPRVEA